VDPTLQTLAARRAMVTGFVAANLLIHNMNMLNKKLIKRIALGIIVVFIALAIYLFLKKPGKITPPIEKTISLTTTTLSIPPSVYPTWLNNIDLVYAKNGNVYVLDTSTNEEKVLIDNLSENIKALVASDNVLFIETGLPFVDDSKFYVYNNDKLREINLSTYSPVVSYSINPYTDKILFMGNYDPEKNTGSIYTYDIFTDTYSNAIMNNFPFFSSIFWINEDEGVLYNFADISDKENLIAFNLSTKQTRKLNFSVPQLSLTSLSPDKKMMLISGENKTMVIDLKKYSTSLIEDKSYYGAWLDNNRIILFPLSMATLPKIYNINDKSTTNIEIPDSIKNQTPRTILLSPDNKRLILRTQNGVWTLFDLATVN